MFNFIKDFYGDGFTVMHDGMTEHFLPEVFADNKFVGDHGGYGWRKMDGGLFVVMADPLDRLKGALSFALILGLCGGFFAAYMFLNIANMGAAMVYLFLGVLCARSLIGPLHLTAVPFLLAGYGSIAYLFMYGEGGDNLERLMVMIILFMVGVVSLLFVANFELVGGIETLIEFIVLLISYFLLSVYVVFDFDRKWMQHGTMAWYIMVIGGILAGIGLLIAIIFIFSAILSDRALGNSFLSFVWHLAIGIVLLFLSSQISDRMYGRTGATIIILLYCAAGFVLTIGRDDPFAVKSGLFLPIGFVMLCSIWSSCVESWDPLLCMLNSLNITVVQNFMVSLSNRFLDTIHTTAWPLAALAVRFFPGIGFLSDGNLVVDCIYTFVLLKIFIMIGIDLRFSFIYKAIGKKKK